VLPEYVDLARRKIVAADMMLFEKGVRYGERDAN